MIKHPLTNTGQILPSRDRHKEDPIFLCLGRYGDILNVLPLAKEWSDTHGKKARFLVAKPFASILEAVSYVTPIIWDGDYADQHRAIGWCRKNRINGDIINCQAYGHIDKARTCSSYQIESWRHAGAKNKFGTMPLVLDNRSDIRESALIARHHAKKPIILVAAKGVSSPFIHGKQMLQDLREEFSDHYEIIDLGEVVASNVVDILGLIDVAACLVSIDTIHLHLARACQTPVVSIINDGWHGSVPPPTTVETIRYAEFSIENARRGIHKALNVAKDDVVVAHCCNTFGKEDRHKKARASIKKIGLKEYHAKEYERSSKDIKDERELPFWKDILAKAKDELLPRDIIIWSNDDIILDPEIVNWAREHVGTYGAASMRRQEIGDTNALHCGRDLFAFRVDWLRKYWDEIPDYIIGAQEFDLGLAAFIRLKAGIITTINNVSQDIFPCETEHRYAYHTPHLGNWIGKEESSAGKHNTKLFEKWRQQYRAGAFWA